MLVKVMKGSDYNYNFGEDQGKEAEFSMSDIDDEPTNFLKEKFNSLSNEGKRKPLPLKDSQWQNEETKEVKCQRIRNESDGRHI